MRLSAPTPKSHEPPPLGQSIFPIASRVVCSLSKDPAEASTKQFASSDAPSHLFQPSRNRGVTSPVLDKHV